MTTAVITGGASGFGLALAKNAAALGMNVAVLDRDGARAADEAARLGPLALGREVDVTDAAGVEAAAQAVREAFGGADLVVSNVGVQLFGAVELFTDDEWKWLLDVNVIGAARVARAFLPLLRASQTPRLAFTTSSSVLDPASHLGAYQASKFAVWGLAETLRLELAPDGVEVTVLLPSGMASRHLESSQDAQPAHVRRPVVREGELEAVITSNPAMAMMLATPEDAAAGVIEAILAGDPYVITRGDLKPAIAARAEQLTKAAEAATPG